MKKELFAAALLTLLLALSLLNTHEIGKLCDQLQTHISAAGDAAQAGDWEESAKCVDDALKLWRSKESYTKIVLRHNDIETLTDDFFELTEHIYVREPGAVKSAVMLVSEHLTGISEMESINPGSIF